MSAIVNGNLPPTMPAQIISYPAAPASTSSASANSTPSRLPYVPTSSRAASVKTRQALHEASMSSSSISDLSSDDSPQDGQLNLLQARSHSGGTSRSSRRRAVLSSDDSAEELVSSSTSLNRHKKRSTASSRSRYSQLSSDDSDVDMRVTGKSDDDASAAIEGDEDLSSIDTESPSDSASDEEPAAPRYLSNSNSRHGARPSLKKRKKEPTRSWPVPHESVIIPMGTERALEHILGVRAIDPATTDDFAVPKITPDGSTHEFLIKFKHTSYIHCDWIPQHILEQTQHLGNHRVKKFLATFKGSAWGAGEYFNPSYTRVDRVIDEGEVTDVNNRRDLSVFYLVKWCSLGYESCTWEKKEVLEKIAPEKIQEFVTRREIGPHKTEVHGPLGRRPSLKVWNKYAKSNIYKNHNELREYQIEGLNWLTYCYLNNRCSIIADEMGLGKTVQIVCFLNELYMRYKITGPFLIIAPLSTLTHWADTFQSWTDMNAVVFHGNSHARNLIVDTEYYYKDSRGQIIPYFYKFDALITTYEQAVMFPEKFRKIYWRCAVLDEGHRLRNKSTKLFEALSTYHMDHRIIISGTPLQNSLEELSTLLNFLEPEKFPSVDAFMAEYGDLKSSTDVDKLQKLLQPIMLRRLKEDVEKSIPMKEETIVDVELTNVQKKLYRALLEKNLSHLTRGSEGKSGITLMLNVLMMLRQVCIHPYLIKGGEDFCMKECNAETPEQQYHAMIEASGKMVLIDKLLKKLRKDGHKVLIFSQMTGCLDIIGDYLAGQGWKYSRIDGRVRGSDRQAAIDRFCNPESDVFVFLLCTRAGGVGLNLTASDTAIIFDSDWNPQNDLQAQARVHRIGQKKPVKIYRLITRNTYEKDMFDRASLKLGLDKAVLQRFEGINGNSDSPQEHGTTAQPLEVEKTNSKLNRKEIEQLLKRGAYGALMDDTESSRFCEEDIDQILSRRTTVIRHGGSNEDSEQGASDAPRNQEKGIFSKASFNMADQADVDVNDPDFWNKFASKAGMKVEEVAALEELGPRATRSNNTFSSPSTSSMVDSRQDEAQANGPNSRLPRSWKFTEKLHFERKLIIYGIHQFDKIATLFPRRTLKDLKAICRAILSACISKCPEVRDDQNLVAEMTDVIEELGQELVLDPENPEAPYLGATKRQIDEYKSFLINAPEEYVTHLTKKGKFMCSRISLLRQIRNIFAAIEDRHKVDIPKLTRPPADWWTEKEDRDLLIGTLVHGYQQYELMQVDPSLVFSQRRFINSHDKEKDDEEAATGSGSAINGSPRPDALDQEVPTASSTPSVGSNGFANQEAAALKSASSEDARPLVKWPARAELGQRIRRLITAISRQNKTGERQLTREKKQEEKLRQKHERAQKWTKKERAEFIKVLLLYGVELPDPSLPAPGRNWEMFKRLSNLSHKTWDTLEEYYQQVLTACKELLGRDGAPSSAISPDKKEDKVEDPQKPTPNPEEDLKVADVKPAEEANPDKQAAEEVTPDKAKRITKRLEFMESLRGPVLHHPDFPLLIKKSRRTAGLPEWWISGTHDQALLEAVAMYGFSRYEMISEDPSFPFFELKNEGKTLPREGFLNKRVETICANIMNPKHLLNKKDRKEMEQRQYARDVAAGLVPSAAASVESTPISFQDTPSVKASTPPINKKKSRSLKKEVEIPSDLALSDGSIGSSPLHASQQSLGSRPPPDATLTSQGSQPESFQPQSQPVRSGLKLKIGIIGKRKRREVEIDYDTSDSGDATEEILAKAVRVLRTVRKEHSKRNRKHRHREPEGDGSGLSVDPTSIAESSDPPMHEYSIDLRENERIPETPSSVAVPVQKRRRDDLEDPTGPSTPSFLSGSMSDSSSSMADISSNSDTGDESHHHRKRRRT